MATCKVMRDIWGCVHGNILSQQSSDSSSVRVNITRITPSILFIIGNKFMTSVS